MTLRDDQIRRYSRHVLLPDVGGTGQKRLLAGQVAIDVLDAAGQAAALYLAAAGVGTLVVRDRGVVAGAGPLFHAADVGTPCVDAARARVAELNDDCRVVADGEAAVVLALPALADPVRAMAAGAAAARLALRALVRSAGAQEEASS